MLIPDERVQICRLTSVPVQGRGFTGTRPEAAKNWYSPFYEMHLNLVIQVAEFTRAQPTRSPQRGRRKGSDLGSGLCRLCAMQSPWGAIHKFEATIFRTLTLHFFRRQTTFDELASLAKKSCI